MLTAEADKTSPLDNDWPDCRSYAEDVNPDAIDGDKWLDNDTSYIWKVGVLAQWDSNKCDYARLFIGHERQPGRAEFIGMLHWRAGENDDIGRCLLRYLECASSIHPVFYSEMKEAA
jgi:hypothetical protein